MYAGQKLVERHEWLENMDQLYQLLLWTDNEQTARQLALVRGVRAYVEKDWQNRWFLRKEQEKLQANHEEANKGWFSSNGNRNL